MARMSLRRSPQQPDVIAWHELGRNLATPHGDVFVVDLAPNNPAQAQRDPVVVLHGFPTSSFDWRHVLDALGRGERRIVLFDFLGFGLSSKSDIRYGIDLHAGTALTILEQLDIHRCVLVTHDMGDSVGGEMLARTMTSGVVVDDPAWFDPSIVVSGTRRPPGSANLDVSQRIIVNGSIYLDLASLTEGQQRLWSAEDARLPDELGQLIGGDAYADGLARVFHPDHQPDASERAAQIELMEFGGGHLLLPRLIRYLDDRKRAEARYTGAIELHPSPMTILWAQQDPVAVAAMGEQLAQRCPRAQLNRLDGLGHYPMIEDPVRFGAALAGALANS